MLTEIYIEALPVDEELGDLVWEMWVEGKIDDDTALVACLLVVRHMIEN